MHGLTPARAGILAGLLLLAALCGLSGAFSLDGAAFATTRPETDLHSSLLAMGRRLAQHTAVIHQTGEHNALVAAISSI